MLLIDRHILLRFLSNFLILFVLLYLFAVVIDFILALERFVDAAHDVLGEDASGLDVAWAVTKFAVGFQAPRFFQFYAYLHGLVAVGAMAFTLAQMHRFKELVAILASGIGMQRVAWPFIVGVFGLSMLQLLNQELMLPRVAPLLLRSHGSIGQTNIDEFPLAFTPDGKGALFQAPTFIPDEEMLVRPTILERDERGRTTRRVTAEFARWSERESAEGEIVQGWMLEDGQSVSLRLDEADGARGPIMQREAVEFYATDLSPRVLIVQRYGQYAAMLSMRQISQMLATPGVADADTLLRYRYTRFSAVLVNVLVMFMALPTFLIREPANLLMRSLACAGMTIPALLGSAIFMMMPLPGIPPAVGVFMPVAILLPIVLSQWTYLRT